MVGREKQVGLRETSEPVTKGAPPTTSGLISSKNQ